MVSLEDPTYQGITVIMSNFVMSPFHIFTSLFVRKNLKRKVFKYIKVKNITNIEIK